MQRAKYTAEFKEESVRQVDLPPARRTKVMEQNP
jgi:hypothetical protein